MKLSKLYKVVLASSMMVASAAVFAAQPNAKVYSSSINIEGLYNADVQKNIDSQISKLTSKKYTLVLKDLTEEEIKAAVDKYPEVTGVTVDSDKIRSIAALAGMKNLESVYINSKYVSDYTPLADKVTLTSLRIDSEDIDTQPVPQARVKSSTPRSKVTASSSSGPSGETKLTLAPFGKTGA